MKAKDLVELADEELAQRLKNSREELFNLRFQHAAGQLENTGSAASGASGHRQDHDGAILEGTGEGALMAGQQEIRQRERQGVVVSDKMDKTIVVAGERGQAACLVQEGRASHLAVEGS